MGYAQATDGPTTIRDLQRLRDSHIPITMLTCYDASFAKLLSRSGLDCILVGDSLGMVVQGNTDTVSVDTETIVYHTRSVVAGAGNVFVIADMPFGSYHTTREDAFVNASKMLRAGAKMVKVEGAGWVINTIEFLVQRDIPVCAHLGLTPQSVHRLGGYPVQGRGGDAQRLVDDAQRVEDAGAQLLVLEAIPADLATEITHKVSIPTIGIGAGSGTSGQVLVLYDMLGISSGRLPRFVRNFMQDAGSIDQAVSDYIQCVRDKIFPSEEHQYSK